MVPLNSLISSVLIFSLLTTPLVDVEVGLQFRVRAGGEQPEARPATKTITATELTQSETESLLRRLPPLKPDATDVQEFTVREGSLAAPPTGNISNASFPAAPTADNATVNAGPLEVVRYSPEGAVAMAPELSITFSQPMIDLTSQSEAATNALVKLNPQPPGNWRWLRTKTHADYGFAWNAVMKRLTIRETSNAMLTVVGALRLERACACSSPCRRRFDIMWRWLIISQPALRR